MFAKELLNYISSISKPLKHIRYFLKKNTAYVVNMKKQSKIKPIKAGKELRTTYCLGSKNHTHNFKPHEVK